MHMRSSLIGAVALAAASLAANVPASAFDVTKYPDFVGIWERADQGPPRFDPSKPPGPAQQAPLKPESQAQYQATLKHIAEGGKWDHPSYTCLAPGMPMIMTAHEPLEIVILPDITYIMSEYITEQVRRVFTDDHTFPAEVEAAFVGYSVGKWLDTDGDGKFDTLEIETRNLKGPRVLDDSGLALHPDDMTVVKERLFLDKADRNVLHDEITVIDNVLTRPWTAVKSYKRETIKRTVWPEKVCAETNTFIKIGKEYYNRDANGFLMLTMKNQAPPDLRHFPN
jgi:hypothetical protein